MPRRGVCHIILPLSERTTHRGYYRIAVVDWQSDVTVRLLEKRMIFYKPSGTEISGGAKGWTYEDFQLLLVNKDQILDLLRKGPPDYPPLDIPREAP